MNSEEKEVLQIVGNRVMRWRLHEKLTQEQLSHFCGVSRSQLSRLENGRENPSLLTMLRVAMALDIKLIDLIAKEPPK